MTFLELQKANETIKTTDIGKGKEYAEVNQRIKAFRMLHPEGCIATEVSIPIPHIAKALPTADVSQFSM